MSKVFDAVQALHLEMERRRSSSTQLPERDTEKEVRPMGNACGEYPSLDRPGLREGYKMCVENARRLIADARVLTNASRYRSADLILRLALEELGNAIQLYEAGRSGVQDWEAWWTRYFSHPKSLESTSLGIATWEQAGDQFGVTREDLVYVGFDKNDGRFVAPLQDNDSELPASFDKKAVYAEEVLRALPSHAFERWEFQEMVQQSPDIGPPVLYALIEELVGQEPTVSESDLLTAIAGDLGRSPDDFIAGFERWKKVAPKARVYVKLLRHVQDRRKAQETG
jgi:AbiV family abortive infection protein